MGMIFTSITVTVTVHETTEKFAASKYPHLFACSD